ncbi:sigma-70 family RNA polymerase sigma factor [Candidatus Poribacteria bacterium]|nr:sigma-70 family RNA polymerase sigma factor [Candidatus Poribacteria bacterium]
MAVDALPEGEDKRFEDGVLSQIGAIRRIGVRLLRSRQDLDDFTQEVVLCVFAHRADLRDERCLPSYVWTVATNTARMWNRKQHPILMATLPDRPVDEPSAFERIASEESRQTLSTALRTLRPADELLLRSFYFAEDTYAELERRCGLSQKALSVRLTRARQRLRGCLSALLSAVWAFLFPARRARAFGELSGGMMTMRPAMVLTACLMVAGGVGVGRYVAAEPEAPPVAIEDVLPVELVQAGGGVAEKPSPLVAQLPAAPMQALLEGKWTQKADMLEPRNGAASAVVNGRLLVFGGATWGVEHATVREYDPAADTWVQKRTCPRRRSEGLHARLTARCTLWTASGSRSTTQPTTNGRSERGCPPPATAVQRHQWEASSMSSAANWQMA